MGDYTPLKTYFDESLASLLSGKIPFAYPGFASESYVQAIAAKVEPLELKARVAVHSAELRKHLPEDYAEALSILLSILGPENPKETGMFTEGYWLMPVAHFVEVYGLEHFDLSTAAIYQITKGHTGEYAIRPYLMNNPDQCIRLMHTWAKNSNKHVRRLASEGMRPRLPWAKNLDQFINDPTPIFGVLEHLKSDESAYVRKSVANNMNDILNDNYDLAFPVLDRWARNAPPNTNWIIKHALRNLKKSKDAKALHLLAKLD